MSQVDDFGCSTLRVKTLLRAPDQAVLSAFRVKDTLHVTYNAASNTLEALTQTGQLAGKIITNSNQDIVVCLQKGTRFTAQILSRSGGRFEMLITAH